VEWCLLAFVYYVLGVHDLGPTVIPKYASSTGFWRELLTSATLHNVNARDIRGGLYAQGDGDYADLRGEKSRPAIGLTRRVSLDGGLTLRYG
jgi:hypothetical protein